MVNPLSTYLWRDKNVNFHHIQNEILRLHIKDQKDNIPVLS